MSLAEYARIAPERAAYIDPDTGETLTYGELDERSIKLGRLLRRHFQIGDRFSILLENGAGYFVAAWAGRRSGLRYVPVNWHLGAEEAAYIVSNSDSRGLICSPHLAGVAEAIVERTPGLELLISEKEGFGPFMALDQAIANESAKPLDPEIEGVVMFYSSGTTGQPKGILRPLPTTPLGTRTPLEQNMVDHFGFTEGARYYTPAPLYHGAPTAWTMGSHQHGGTVILPKRFDAEETLRHLQDHRVTHAQFVPTHFIRMLQLPEGVRAKYDLTSLRVAIHAAAPCPVEVKEKMIDWWGPIIHEYYGQSEGVGMTAIGPQEWLEHKGSVGRSTQGSIHIVGDDGSLLPPGEAGRIMFESANRFEYHKEKEKTAETYDERGWVRSGDIGWMDADRYLYVTDRVSHMIISGGVNIYPQEVESVLALHPDVRDVAVIGVPDAEFGEQVKAVIECKDGVILDAGAADRVIAFCRERLAAYKCPKTVDFTPALPRLPTGKLLKRELRKQYWPEGKAI